MTCGPFRDMWDRLAARKAASDHETDRALAELAGAAAVPLARFRPAASMFLLRLEAPGESGTPPVYLGVTADARKDYVVWWGRPYSRTPATVMHQGPDAREAVATAELMLRQWP